MACHFARWVAAEPEPDTHRLPPNVLLSARSLSEKQRKRFLSGRVLLAEMMFYLYGITELPAIITLPSGRPSFESQNLPDFSLAYAGTTVGVMLSSEGKVGLDLEVIHARSALINSQQQAQLSAVEQTWIALQSDPVESALQLWCIRQSMLKLSGLTEHGERSLSLNPASGRLRSAITPEAQVMSDIDGSLTWACAHSPAIARLLCWRYSPESGFTRTQTLSIQQQPHSPHFMKFTSLPPAK
jgi:phosphopantetheinyl transferase